MIIDHFRVGFSVTPIPKTKTNTNTRIRSHGSAVDVITIINLARDYCFSQPANQQQIQSYRMKKRGNYIFTIYDLITYKVVLNVSCSMAFINAY